MKKTLQTSLLVFIAVVACLIAGAVFGFTDSKSIGKVTVKSKKVVILRDGAVINIGSFGKILEEGDTVVAGETGKAIVSLSSGDEIYLAPWAKLTLAKNEVRKTETRSKLLRVSFEGKIRARVKRSRRSRMQFKTANAEINIKGTEFVAEYSDGMTTLATLEGLVNLQSARTGNQIDVPPGKMSSVSAAGEVLPLSEIAGDILRGVEIAGEKMDEDDVAGEKM